MHHVFALITVSIWSVTSLCSADPTCSRAEAIALEKAVITDMITGDLAAATQAYAALPPERALALDPTQFRWAWKQDKRQDRPIRVIPLRPLSQAWDDAIVGARQESRLVRQWADGTVHSSNFLVEVHGEHKTVCMEPAYELTAYERIEIAARAAEERGTWMLIESEDRVPSNAKRLFWSHVNTFPTAPLANPALITATFGVRYHTLPGSGVYGRADRIMERVKAEWWLGGEFSAPTVGIWRCKPDGSAAEWIGCPAQVTEADWKAMLTGGPVVKPQALAQLRAGLEAMESARTAGKPATWRRMIEGEARTRMTIEAALNDLMGPAPEQPPPKPPLPDMGEPMTVSESAIHQFAYTSNWGVSIVNNVAWAWTLRIQESDTPQPAAHDHVLTLAKRGGSWRIIGVVPAPDAQPNAQNKLPNTPKTDLR